MRHHIKTIRTAREASEAGPFDRIVELTTSCVKACEEFLTKSSFTKRNNIWSLPELPDNPPHNVSKIRDNGIHVGFVFRPIFDNQLGVSNESEAVHEIHVSSVKQGVPKVRIIGSFKPEYMGKLSDADVVKYTEFTKRAADHLQTLIKHDMKNIVQSAVKPEFTKDAVREADHFAGDMEDNIDIWAESIFDDIEEDVLTRHEKTKDDLTKVHKEYLTMCEAAGAAFKDTFFKKFEQILDSKLNFRYTLKQDKFEEKLRDRRLLSEEDE